MHGVLTEPSLQEKLLIPKNQARRVFEILYFNSVYGKNAAARTAFRLFVKKRLIQPHVVRRRAGRQPPAQTGLARERSDDVQSGVF